MDRPGERQATRIRLVQEAPFRLGRTDVRPASCEVVIEGSVRTLEPRIMQVLVALARRPGEVVSRDQLVEACWEGLAVSDDAVNRCVSQLRQLAQTPGAGFAIDTIAKVGYRITTPDGGTGPAEAPAPRGRFGLGAKAWLAAGLLVLPAGAGGAWLVARQPADWTIVDRVVIANTAMDERFPDVSADGRLVSYTSTDAAGGRHIYLKNTSGGDALQLTRDPKWEDMAAAISPGADRVAFVRAPRVANGAAATEPCRIMVKPIPDGLERMVGRCEAEPFTTRLSWSHAGDALYFSDRPARPAGSGLRIRRLDLQTGAVTDVTHPQPATADDANATVSPDGSRLAFVRHPAAESSFVYVMDLASGRLTRITSGGFFAYTAWAADGRSLFVFSSLDADIWNYRADGKGKPRRLTTYGRSGRLAAGGDLIAFEDWGRTSYLASVKDGVESLVTSGERYDLTPEYSPDGALAFASQEGPPTLWIARPRDQPRVLVSPPMTFVEDPRWSPDGRTIAFVGIDHGQASIYLVDAESGTISRFASGGGELGAPAWSADGKALIYPQHEAAGWRLWRRGLAAGAKATPISGYGWRHVRTWAGRIYAVREKGPGLWRLDPGAAPVQVAPEPNYDPSEEEDFAHGWTLAGGRLYAVDIAQGVTRATVVSRPIDGGPARVEATNLDWSGGPSRDWYGGITVHPKTGAVVYAKSGRRDNDIAAWRIQKTGPWP